MGVSTDAYLVFGIDLGEEDNWDEDAHLRELTALHDDCEMDDESRVEMVDHCHHDYRMWILAVKGTLKRAYRGSPTEIAPSALTVSAEQMSGLRAFCGEHNIEWKEPKWLLCSMWS
jgi:hypothetical protein